MENNLSCEQIMAYSGGFPDFLCFPNLDQIHIVYMGCDLAHLHVDAVYLDEVQSSYHRS
jgi:hypothetical protein